MTTTRGLNLETRMELSPACDTENKLPLVVSFFNKAVTTVPFFLPGVAVPGGLNISPLSENVASNVELSPSALENAVLLRFRSSLRFSPGDDVRRTVESLLDNSVIFVDDILLSPESSLPERIRSPAEVSLFDSTNQIATADSRFVTFRFEKSQIHRKLDCVAYVRHGAPFRELREALVDAAVRALAAFDQVKDAAYMGHFNIFRNSVVFSIAVSKANSENENSADSIAARKKLHTALGLPLNRVLIRRSCRLFSLSRLDNNSWDGGSPGRLRDVHVGIKGHGLIGESISTHVIGDSYLYCHYMQNRYNDCGWGCAYRSLQTLLSWAGLQRYATFKDGILPSHQEIQTALVAVGDKDRQFIGSREWIGANEVCYALEHLTGISSRILHISSGSEMELASRQLAAHFDDQGSPVMVGGGVLAWTILGVARNERTGTAKFLILDPHFEGKDELNVIQGKGWVGWKGGNIFLKDAFYNLCLPMRPPIL